MVYIIIWFLAYALTLLASTAFGIIALFLKDRDQRFCVDGLLISATLLVALNVGSRFLPVESLSQFKQVSKMPPEARLKQAEYAASSLSNAQFLDSFTGPLRPIMTVDGFSTLKGSLPAAIKTLAGLVEKYPLDSPLVARLIILKHSAGEDIAPILAKYNIAGGTQTDLLRCLTALYEEKASKLGPDQIKAVIDSLPEGWYRRTVLLDAYKQTGQAELKPVEDEFKQKCAEYNQKDLILQLAIISSLIPTGICLYTLYKRRGEAAPPFVALSTDFRRVYGTMLSVFYAQSITEFFIGVIFGVAVAFSHGKMTLDSLGMTVAAVSVVSNLICGTLAFYWFICKPQGMNPFKAYCQGLDKYSGLSLVKIAFTVYCCMYGLNFLTRVLTNLIPNYPHGPSNAGQIAMLKALVNFDWPAIVFYTFLICVVAPVVEELLCRGLLYGWLRSRMTAPLAIITSSILFAAWHFDLVGFPQYFVLGLILCYVYERTRCLPICVAAHALWNISILAMGCALLTR